MKYIVLAIAVLMYALVIAFQDKKVWFTSVAALALLVIAAVFPTEIFKSGGADASPVYGLLHSISNVSVGGNHLESLINWNVLMIYVGAMTIAALFLYSKVPARIADVMVEKSRSAGIAVVLILAMTGIISIFVENVATVLVMAPIAIALSKKLKINITPFMIGLAVMSNLEGTATLVGDPPSMIFASYSGYNFNDFFVHQGKLSIFFIVQVGLVVGCIFFYVIFARYRDKAQVDREDVVSWFPLWLLLAMIFGLAVISFLSDGLTYVSGCFVVVLAAIGILWYVFCQKKSCADAWEVIKGLDWETIFFLIGIFVVVGAVSETGLLDDFAAWLGKVSGGSKFLGFFLILLFSVLISGFVDNVPYIIVMLPVAGSLAANMAVSKELFMFALLVGSCLGGNLTPFGASANIAAMGILKDEGKPVSFGGFLKISAPFTLLTTAASALVLWFLWA